ncbi:NADH dehydrogenase [ubiquinone] 1 alpha subcomplex subunit 5 [Silurus asotus]|uniref:NADH dehydrogenase [ubiquinone] 1 alpha subcomplex subunit 5 n=1 Tax=Silurus asotus TaxID=30991 RepID=A0AAD5FJ45_SILAS|nr:NADH dehydrogenase [ubiquinone] 1 alpha subcomplex subunit 5 [Silurus asotus]
MAGVIKKTTGLVGLAVSVNPHERLRILYSKILGCVQAMPRDAAYRKYTEQLITERLDHVKLLLKIDNRLILLPEYEPSGLHEPQAFKIYWLVNAHGGTFSQKEPDVEKLEKKMNCGQIEEVIAQAEAELVLSRKMAEWKPWEPLIEDAPPNQWKWPV